MSVRRRNKMGLESHITRELQRAKSGFVEGEDYWFENGLTTGREEAAREIAILLDESGQFGPTRVVRVPTPHYVTSRKGTWKVEFGVHRSYYLGDRDLSYQEYEKRFKEFREEAR
jgi:hypothetical protein